MFAAPVETMVSKWVAAEMRVSLS